MQSHDDNSNASAQGDPDAPGTEPEAITETAKVTRTSRKSTARRVRKVALWVLAIPLVLLMLLLIAWGIDTLTSADQVARNTNVAGTPVGGMTEGELDSTLSDLDEELPDTPVVIETDDITVESTAGDLGITIDDASTSEAVMNIVDDESPITRPFIWARSFFSPREADVAVSVDEDQLEEKVTELEGEDRVAPVEPEMIEDGDHMAIKPGEDGVELTAVSVVDSLPSALGDISEEIVVVTERTVVPPLFNDDFVQGLADQANTILDSTVTVTAGEDEFDLDGSELFGQLTVAARNGYPGITIEPAAIATQLEEQVPGSTTNPTDVSFDIRGGVPVPVAGHDAEVCCGEGSADLIVDAFIAGDSEVEVPTRTITAAEGVQWAQGLGVNQVVAEFTTNHKCCESRVTNIHRISDATRGALIPPGGTWSVNGHVGRRTVEKGYLEGGVIHDGEFKTDVGGGVSQYATTLFNAAFFGGYDIAAYKMHSKYISRYPYGREATLDFPGVDLKIHNDSPYGVVVWPTYTDTSVTVQLWSTPYGRGDQTAQNQSSGCGSVRTTRTTTFPDKQPQTDTFRANYDCD